MPRKPHPEATVIDVQAKTVALDASAAAQNQLAEFNAQAKEAAKAMATRLNYEGALSLDALEDEIRFYQRRTVETCLELGKRLLVLKELSPHGEFQQRVEALGISARTAQTFMSATLRTLKSETVALLTNRVKNVKAFLELVTHDDDTIVELSKLDEFDKMSASELREAARAKERTIATTKETLGNVRDELDALKAQPKRKPKLSAEQVRDYEAAPLHELVRSIMVEVEKLEAEVQRLQWGDDDTSATDLTQQEAAHAVALLMQRLQNINATARLNLSLASVMGEEGAEQLAAFDARIHGLADQSTSGA